jgi:hypothetical protein
VFKPGRQWGYTDLTKTPRKTEFYIDPLPLGGELARHGYSWNEVDANRRVGLFGHVVRCAEDYTRGREIRHDKPALLYKIEYWQFFGFNTPHKPFSIGDHEGDWATVQLIVSSDSLAIQDVFHYAHGKEMRFHMQATRSTQDTLVSSQRLAAREYRGPRYSTSNLIEISHPDLPPPTPVTLRQGLESAQDNLVRLARDPETGEFTHPVAYVENGSHEFWPSEFWSYAAAPKHTGDSAHAYLAEVPPNLGEVEYPLSAYAAVILRYNGFWGAWSRENHTPPGPPLHTEWLWPANSTIRHGLAGLED